MGVNISTNRMFPQSELQQLLRYDSATGHLFWLKRDASRFSNQRQANQWNGKWAGKRAFTSLMGSGYAQGSVNGKRVMAHRVVWALVRGDWPHAIDHVNGIRSDNRLENLRAVTDQQNQRNQKRSARNSSGVMGVYWSRNRKKWVAQIVVDYNLIFLGRFDSKKEAVAARKNAERLHGFHKNHGLTAQERAAA